MNSFCAPKTKGGSAAAIHRRLLQKKSWQNRFETFFAARVRQMGRRARPPVDYSRAPLSSSPVMTVSPQEDFSARLAACVQDGTFARLTLGKPRGAIRRCRKS